MCPSPRCSRRMVQACHSLPQRSSGQSSDSRPACIGRPDVVSAASMPRRSTATSIRPGRPASPSTWRSASTAPDSFAARMSASVHTARPASYRLAIRPGSKHAERRGGDRARPVRRGRTPGPRRSPRGSPARGPRIGRRPARPEADRRDRLDRVAERASRCPPYGCSRLGRIDGSRLEERDARLGVVHAADRPPTANGHTRTSHESGSSN